MAWPVATERLSLRRATAADVSAVSAIRARPGVSDWLTVDARDRAAFVEYYSDPARLRCALAIERDGTVIGDAMIRVGDAWAQAEVADRATGVQAELGWVLDPAHSGVGLGTEAVRALLSICFDQLGLHRVFADCFADNEPSWRLMERVGMRREAHTIGESLHRSGRWLDGLGYAMLAGERPA